MEDIYSFHKSKAKNNLFFRNQGENKLKFVFSQALSTSALTAFGAKGACIRIHPNSCIYYTKHVEITAPSPMDFTAEKDGSRNQWRTPAVNSHWFPVRPDLCTLMRRRSFQPYLNSGQQTYLLTFRSCPESIASQDKERCICCGTVEDKIGCLYSLRFTATIK